MAVRFQHLLVPVDLSDADISVFDAVTELAGGDGTSVTLLHVIEAIDSEPDEELEEFYQSLETKARQKLAEIGERLTTSGLSVELEIVFGQRVAQIVGYSVQQNIDLVVMRSRRVDLTNPDTEWQSLSHQVSILSQCPVLLLK